MALIRPRHLLILFLITFVQTERVNVQMRQIVPINNLREVLTCTFAADSIDCKDSPDFYHLNMEIGKEQEKKEEEKKENNRKIQKRKPEKRRENIIMHNSIMEEEMRDIEDDLKEHIKPSLPQKADDAPILLEAVIENVDSEIEDAETEQKNEEELDRIVMEKNMRNMKDMYGQRDNDSDRRDNDNDRVDNDNETADNYNERDIDDGRELEKGREIMRNERVLRRQTFRFRSDV
ncbi:unnamed protein product [Spodoptera littoralis]|uniref:Uncharacterized protein n=1 Tax=Spodoptera littoralis TaxID=7109 RepID=A0A9P0IA54_SPOLI|nr:unnamed protein product [Spodoptera littoralis]CAH1642883.1 unnamed protein product [Spodoptera littoralis]